MLGFSYADDKDIIIANKHESKAPRNFIVKIWLGFLDPKDMRMNPKT